VCTGTSTGLKLEEIKQCEIITILRDSVGAEKVLMSVIDVAWSVFGPGLFRVVHRQGKTTLEDMEGCDDH